MAFLPSEYARGMRLVQSDPAESIRRAQANSNIDLKCIVNFLQSIPALQTPTVIKIFISNLAPDLVPDPRALAAPRSPSTLAADRAITSILGIGNMCPYLLPSPHSAPFLSPLKEAWPGIWKWMQFFYHMNQDPRKGSPEQMRTTSQLVSYAIYSMTHDDRLQKIVTNTEGVIPLITKFWVDEDKVVPGGEEVNTPILPIPVSTAALHQVLIEANDRMLDQVVANSFPGAPEKTIDFLLDRLRNAIKKPSSKFSAGTAQTFIDLTISFSRAPMHAFRRNLLSKGLIGLITRALLILTTHPLHEDNVLDAITSCFGCISNLVECGDGITYIRQTINEGFFQAFVNMMPNFHRLGPEARSFTIGLVEDLLPRYLVYRSVIESVVKAMRELDTDACRSKVASSPVKESWYLLKKIAESRMIAKESADDYRKVAACCDYCQKEGPKETFKQCTGCRVTLYCSKECQVASWKKQHKAECNLKDQERISASLLTQHVHVLTGHRATATGFHSDALRKQDRLFLHSLTIREARIVLPTIRNLARTQFPDSPMTDLGIKIDYTRVPPRPSVFKLEGHDMTTCMVDEPVVPTTSFSTLSPGLLISNGNKFDGARSREAQERARQKVNLHHKGDLSYQRSFGILQKAIDNKGKLTLIESIVSAGEMANMILTLAAKNLWDDGDLHECEAGEGHCHGAVGHECLVKNGEEGHVDLGGKVEDITLNELDLN